jgi:hypothetical protein
VATPFTDTNAVFSPDMRWIAYQSAETGTVEVYVQPFPPTGGKYQVSKGGGAQPAWRRDGRELYFLAPPDGRLMAVSVDGTRQPFDVGVPQQLFATAAGPATGRQYVAAKDGQRFLILMQMPQPTVEAITVIVNWPAAIQK